MVWSTERNNRMSANELIALKEYISAAIKKQIEDAFGRDALQESVALNEAERELDRVILETNHE